MKYFKISTLTNETGNQNLVPVTSVYDLISSNKRFLYYVLEDQPELTQHYPLQIKFIDTITIIKIQNHAQITIIPSIEARIKSVDAKKYSPRHFELLRIFHNDLAVNKLLQIIALDGFLLYPENTILRILTEDNRAYALYRGMLFSINITLRLSKIIGVLPNTTIKEIQVGDYTAKNIPFTFERMLCPKKDLHFGNTSFT